MSQAIEIRTDDIDIGASPRPTISDFDVVASYNWLDEANPTILVPGLPPVWKAPLSNPVVTEDTKAKYIDQNADRNPSSPLEPLLVAVKTTSKDFDYNNIDIISDRSPIRKLLGFVAPEHGDPKNTGVASFSILIEVVGDTAIFNRCQSATRQTEGIIGYRSAFDKHYLKISASVGNSTSHHRIIRYKFGGLNFLIRFAIDAFLPTELPDRSVSQVKNVDEDVLVDLLRSTALDSSPSRATEKTVEVRQGGQVMPQSAMLEIITRNDKYPYDIERRLPDLWISQTQHFLRAHWRPIWKKRQWPPSQTRGRQAQFHEFNLTATASLTDKWAEDNAEALKKLAGVCKLIVEKAKEIKRPCMASFSGVHGHPLVLEPLKEGEEYPSPSEKMKALLMTKTAEREHAVAVDDEAYLADKE